ncbi:hypothetical protein J6A31_02560 [bacterium]|nr:hypothetical protein [bacterium]
MKIREFQSYVKHNISSYDANKALNNLLIDATYFSRNLFRTIFSGLKSNSADEIVRKGYTGMRNFIFKV